MSLDTSALRLLLAQKTPEAIAMRALALLDAQGVTAGRLNPIHTTAASALSLWRTRERISKHTGTKIPGVASLNSRLSRLLPDAIVEQYNFDSDHWAGSIFIDPAKGEFLGDTIVQRRPNSRKMLSFEDEPLQPARKSA